MTLIFHLYKNESAFSQSEQAIVKIMMTFTKCLVYSSFWIGQRIQWALNRLTQAMNSMKFMEFKIDQTNYEKTTA